MIKRICVEVNNVFYKSLNEASKDLKIDHATVKNRALSEKWLNYKIVDFRINYSEKKCTKCGKTKDLKEFRHCKNKLDGKSSWCNECHSKDNIQRDRQDRTKPRKRINKYYKTSKGKIARRVNKALRRARMKNAYVYLSKREQEEIYELYKEARLLREAGNKVVIDHIIPISKGGKHHPSNLRIVSEEFNLKKGNKLDWDMDGEIITDHRLVDLPHIELV